MACDSPQEDSIEFVPVLFVAITRRNVASLDQETRVGEQMVGSDITTISTFTWLGTAVEYRISLGHHGVVHGSWS